MFCCSIINLQWLQWCQLKPIPTVGCEHFVFLEQAVEEIEHGLDSTCTESTEISELDVSFDEPAVIAFSVSLGFLLLISILSFINVKGFMITVTSVQ